MNQEASFHKLIAPLLNKRQQGYVMGVWRVVHDNPIPMVLHCPNCGTQHVDKEEREVRGGDLCVEDWRIIHHRSHKCHACGTVWRPADVPTVGVTSLETRGKVDTWPRK